MNKLLLESRNDIPFPEARVSIHQPTINEISFIGEDDFWAGCQFLNFSLEDLKTEDKSLLEDKTDFEVFMSIMSSTERASYKLSAKMVLTLLFPDYIFSFEKDKIELTNINDKTYITAINAENFDSFKEIIKNMFDLSVEKEDKSNYNPADARAAKIAEQLKKGKEKAAKLKGEVATDKEIEILKRFISILAVGEKKDKNELMEYTVTQLKDEFQRFQMKEEFDMYLKAKMAGAENLDEVPNWMGPITEHK